MPTDDLSELTEVLSHYDLGELVQQEKDRRGTVNTSFFIETLKEGERRKFFLRKYKRGVRREEVLFEHSLINHIAGRTACPVARVYPTRQGQTFLHHTGPEGDGEDVFYAVFDFLPGEDRYTWVGPRCVPGELRNAGALLARFHNAVSTLAPQGQRQEPKIGELLGVIDAMWREVRGMTKGTVFDAYLAQHFDLVRQSIAETLAVLHEPAARHLPEVIIHSDYHPGNLKFEGEAISGLVDFDWSKVDRRAFDVGLAVWYFCVSWEGAADGRLRLGEARIFLTAYQSQLLAKRGLGALSEAELHYLPHLINAGSIYVLYWTLRDYFGKSVDAKEYLTYLKHSVTFIRWFSVIANRQKLRSTLAALPHP